MTLQLFHFRLAFLPFSLASSTCQHSCTRVHKPLRDSSPTFVTLKVISASPDPTFAGIEERRDAAEFFLRGGGVI